MTYVLPERIRARIEIDEGCWLWRGCLSQKGYGVARWGGRKRLLHRAVWEAVNGAVPEGYVVHHECRRKACCNPEHLQVVTNAENRRLDRGLLCRKGLHPMDEENRHPVGRCRECNRQWYRDRLRRRRGADFGVWRDRNRVMT